MSFIYYEVNNPSNQTEKSSLPPETLAEAIELYIPDADLYLLIGDYLIQMEVGRDMSGFYKDLIEVMGNLRFDIPSNDFYKEALGEVHPELKIYTIVLTDFHAPPIIFFYSVGNRVCIQTRTLQSDKVIAIATDIKFPVCYEKDDLIYQCCQFLYRYLNDLTREMPDAKSFSDYKSDVETLNKICPKNEGIII